MNPVSNKRRIQLKRLRKLTDSMEPVCYFCGGVGTDTAHLIRRSYSTALIDNATNIVKSCRPCHTLFDDHPKEWAEKYPQHIEKVFTKMISLDPFYAARWFNKLG